MDKFQMFLPFSSTAQPTFDQVSSSMKNPNPVNDFQAHHHHHHHHEGSNGFLGFGAENLFVPTSSELVKINGRDSSINNQFACGSEGEGKPGKKKGERKVRRPRYAFQTRSQVDILDDGYRWRKYGQKAVKANKFPRNYYRCTHQGCNVKKQVQRLTKDEEVVVTTYEGMHSHPIEKPTDNFEHILSQMQIFTTTPF